MCSPSDSNLIAEERDSLLAQGLTPPSNYAQFNNKTLVSMKQELQQDVYTILEQGVRVLKFTGGEPLVQQPVLDVLNYIVDKGYAKDIRLQLTTNATKFSTRFMDLFKEFDRVHLNISVDGYGGVYEYIRYPYKWSNFNDRIELLKAVTYNSTKISYDFTCVPQLFNIENLATLQQHVGKSNLYMNNILHPEDNYNSLTMVPLDILKQARDDIQYCSSSNILINSINSLIENYTAPTTAQLKTMADSIQVLDINRKQHYEDYLEPRTRDFITESIRTVS
jgi:MoaA/NifB/PqqE/SkfB family radical SAM enzyme